MERDMGAGGRAVLFGAWLAATALATIAPVAEAADVSRRPRMIQVAQAAPVARGFDIAAQPLADALTAFGRQSGMQLSVDASLVRGIASPGLRGSMPPEQALRQLLAHTGITYRLAADGTAMLERLPPGADGSSAVAMPPVSVHAERESAYGPVEGYIAKRSATASKTDTPIIETPRSISVVTADQIEAQKVDNVGAALRYTPGVYAEQRGAITTRTSVVVRGFLSERLVTVDGINNFTTSDLSQEPDAYGLERLEVLRGPASVLYGQGTPGGLIAAISKRPTTDHFAEAEVSAGTFDQYGGKFDLGGPIDDEKKFLFRLTGLARDGDTQVDFAKDDRFFIAPAFTWQPSSSTSLTLLAHYQKDDAYPDQFLPASGTVLPNPNGKISTGRLLGEPGDRFERDKYSLGYAFEHEFNENITIRQNMRYDYGKFDRFNVGIPGNLVNDFRADLRTINRGIFVNNARGSAVGTDTHGEFKFELGETAHTVLTGVDYKVSELHAVFSRQLNGVPGLDVFNPVYGRALPTNIPVVNDRDTDFYQLGVYAQDQIKIFDRLVLNLGGRHDWTTTEVENNLNETTISDQHDKAFTGQAGLAYLFENGITPYANYAESFEPQPGVTFSGAAFKPTTGTQYEVGIKYQPPGHNTLVTLAAFDLTRQNVTTTDPVNRGFSVQTGEVRSRGVEIEARTNPIDGLNLIAGFSYTDTKVTKSNGPDLDKRPTRVPEYLASLWGDYRIQSGLFSGLGFGAGVRYVGNTAGDTVNSFKVPSFTLADAALYYDVQDGPLQGMSLAINAANLLDETFVSECEATSSCLFGARRTVIGSVRYRW
jgi:iron complex outermembrane recepter protein